MTGPAIAPERFTQVRHRCPFCRRSWSSATRARRHVAACWRNPAVRGCKTCRHAGSHAGFIDECAAGEDLGTLIDGTCDLRTMCPLWELLTEGTDDAR